MAAHSSYQAEAHLTVEIRDEFCASTKLNDVEYQRGEKQNYICVTKPNGDSFYQMTAQLSNRCGRRRCR